MTRHIQTLPPPYLHTTETGFTKQLAFAAYDVL